MMTMGEKATARQKENRDEVEGWRADKGGKRRGKDRYLSPQLLGGGRAGVHCFVKNVKCSESTRHGQVPVGKESK